VVLYLVVSSTRSLVSIRIAGESPHGEDVAVSGVGDACGSVEHSGNTFLIPVTRRELYSEQSQEHEENTTRIMRMLESSMVLSYRIV
jgi:hypothetical protein